MLNYLDEARKKAINQPKLPNATKWLNEFCSKHNLTISYNITQKIIGDESDFFELCAKIGSVEAIGGSHSFFAARKVAANALKAKLLSFGDSWQDEVNSPEDFESQFHKDYNFKGVIGAGAYGKVLEVVNKTTEKTMAIKRMALPSKGHAKQQIIRGEIGCLVDLLHKNVIRFYRGWFENPPIGWQKRYDLQHGIIHSDDEDGTLSLADLESEAENDESEDTSKETIQMSKSYLYVEMEFCPWGTLEEWLQSHLDNRGLACYFFLEIIKGIEYIHSKSITHR